MEIEEQEVWQINVRCSKLPKGGIKVPVLPTAPLSQLVEFVNEMCIQENGDRVIEVDFTKLFTRGKLLNNHQSVESALNNGDTVMLVFSTRAEIDRLQQQHTSTTAANRVMRTMEEEDALDESRRAAQNREADVQDSTYKFCKFKTVDRFTTPHPFEAMRMLNRLATDPAIKRIMKQYKWTVGSLEEMDPRTDMIALRKQSEDGACVLGYNENAGHRIFLRLRNDAETEFRSYNSVVNTLLHELTHNVHGPHDEHFWALFAKLKTEYLKFHQVERGVTVNLDRTEEQVGREIRTQGAGNSALLESERAAALKTVAKPQAAAAVLPPPSRLGAANSRARMMEREKLAKAAEKRFAQQQPQQQPEEVQAKPVVAPVKRECACGQQHTIVEPSPLGYDEVNTSMRERDIRQAMITMCRTRNHEAAKLVYTIVRNALTGEEKYLKVKTTGEKFKRLVNASVLALLLSVGFERDDDQEMLRLARNDPGLLTLTKQLIEDSGLLVGS